MDDAGLHGAQYDDKAKIDLAEELAEIVSFTGSFMNYFRHEANDILGSDQRFTRPSARRLLEWSDTMHTLLMVGGLCRSGKFTPELRDQAISYTCCFRECLVKDLVVIDERREAGGQDWRDADLCKCLEQGIRAARALELKLESFAG